MDNLDIKPEYSHHNLEKQLRFEEIWGMPLFKSTTVFPTAVPRNFSEQIVIYRNAGTSQLVIYEPSTGIWKGVIIT